MKLHINSRSNEVEGVVFILNAQLLQKPQRLDLWQPVRSFIRLQRFDNVLCGCGHVVHLVEPAAPEFRLINKYGEFSAPVGPYSGETPSQVIKGRPEILEHIPNEHEQEIGRRMPIGDLGVEMSCWNILLSDNFVWADLQEGHNFVVQGLQVFVCPDEFHSERLCRHEDAP